MYEFRMKRQQTVGLHREGGTVSKFIGLENTSLRTFEGRCLCLRGTKQQGYDEDSVTRSFIISTIHQILLG
jgi:hypothetical protein